MFRNWVQVSSPGMNPVVSGFAVEGAFEGAVDGAFAPGA